MLFPKVSLASTAPAELAGAIRSLGVCGPVYVELSAEWLTYVARLPEADAAGAEDSKEREAALKATAGAWAKTNCRAVDAIVGPFPAGQRALAGVMLDAGVFRLACIVTSEEDAAALARLTAELPSDRFAAIVRPGSDATEDVVAAVEALGPELLRGLGSVIVDLSGTAGAGFAGLRPDRPAVYAASGLAPAGGAAVTSARGTFFSVTGTRAVRAACKPCPVAVVGAGADAGGVGWAHRAHIDVVAAAQRSSAPAAGTGAGAGAASAAASASPGSGDAATSPAPLSIGRCLACCARSDRPDGLVTTVVSDELGVTLGLVYSSAESIQAALAEGRGTYWSRSRAGLWRKGESSGMIQELVSVSLDCDSDALLFRVRQSGSPPAFCHLLTRTCWGEDTSLGSLQRVLQSRLASAPEGSYTKRLFEDPALLRAKLLEEAQELSEAETPGHAAAETADVIYFALVAAVARGASLEDVQDHLHWRSRKVKRRPGNSKPERIRAAAEFFASKQR